MTTGFQTWLGRWVCADSDRTVTANREQQREFETFEPELQADGSVAFRTHHAGCYLCAEPDGRMTNRVPGTEDGRPGPYETFIAHRQGDLVALETWMHTFCCAEADFSFGHRTPGSPDGQPSTYELLAVTPWWKPSYAPPPVLTPADRWFRTTAGDYDYREFSALTLMNRWLRGENLADDFAVWRTLGATHLRLFGMILSDWWDAKGVHYGPDSPTFYDDTAALLDRIAAEGFGVRYSVFCDAQYLGISRIRHLEAIAPILAARPWVIVEVANEPTMNGFRKDDGELFRGVRLLQDRGVRLVATGANHGAEGHFTDLALPPANYVAFHAERRTEDDGWAWVRRLGEYGVIFNDHALPAVSGEPINAGDQGGWGDHQDDLAIWFAYGALSRLVPAKGFLPCLHSDQGLYGVAPVGNTRDCAEAFMAGCTAVPLQARQWPWVNGHHATSPFAGFWQTDPPAGDRPVRIYGRGGPNGYIGMALRSPRDWSPQLRYPVRATASVGTGRFVGTLWTNL